MNNKKERQAEKSDALLLYKDIQRIPAYAFYKKSPERGVRSRWVKPKNSVFYGGAIIGIIRCENCAIRRGS